MFATNTLKPFKRIFYDTLYRNLQHSFVVYVSANVGFLCTTLEIVRGAEVEFTFILFSETIYKFNATKEHLVIVND